MLKRKHILVVLMVAVAFGALPALAMADPEIELHEHTTFTISGETASLASKGLAVSCTSVTGSGKFESSQNGTVEFTYHECKSSGISCTTSGQSTGTITSEELPFRVKSATEGKLALLVSSKEEHFSTFKCSALVSVVVSGNGVIGLMTSPGFGEESSTATLEFSAKEEAQSDKKVDGEETEYSLKAAINGGTAESASLAGVSKLTFAGAIQPPPTNALQIDIGPAVGEGTVKSTPIGIHCVNVCKSLFVQGTKIKLEAVEIAVNFKEWKTKKGNAGTCINAVTPCQLTLNADAELEAVFK